MRNERVRGEQMADTVAAAMQNIVRGEQHRRLFKLAEPQPCCDCTDCCGAKCKCNGKCDELCKCCKACKDSNHAHDQSDCLPASDSFGPAMGSIKQLIDVLSKISTVQDELGLTKSSSATASALATFVKELRKISMASMLDSNNILYDELDVGEEEDPDIEALLRQRVNESDPQHVGIIDIEKAPDIWRDIGTEPASDVPSDDLSDIMPSELDAAIIYPPNQSTWLPDSSHKPTDLPPDSLDIPAAPIAPNIDVPVHMGLENIDREKPTVVPGDITAAIHELDKLIKRAHDDFEDPDAGTGFNYGPGEKSVDDLVREPGGKWTNFKDLTPEERLEQEMGAGLHEQLDIDPDTIPTNEVYPDEFNDDSFADDTMWAMDGEAFDGDLHGSDLDGEMESGNFLALPDEFDIGPENTNAGQMDLSDEALDRLIKDLRKEDSEDADDEPFSSEPISSDDPAKLWPIEDQMYNPSVEDADPGFTRDVPDMPVRVPGEGWKHLNELSDLEQDELDTGAGLDRKLDIDPDQLSTEDLEPISGPISQESKTINEIAGQHSSSPEDDDFNPKDFTWWNEE